MPLGIRFQANTTGDIALIGNTVLQPDASGPNGSFAGEGVDGVGPFVDNNDFRMVYVNTGPNPGPGGPVLFDSSRATLALPAGAEVLFAGLYWGADVNNSPLGNAHAAPDPARANQVLLNAPGGEAYQTITGTVIGQVPAGHAATGPARNYQAFADVTAVVQSAGAGTYTVANLQAGSAIKGLYGGWSLVVAYHAPTEPLRNLTVFDGYELIGKQDVALLNVSGFRAPPRGPVHATVGVVAYDGDLGLTGDSLTFQTNSHPPVQLGDALNPAGNFFDSALSTLGARFTAKDPDFVNQFGFDAKLVSADGAFNNGDTSATITLSTSGDAFYSGVITTALDLYTPGLTSTTTVADVTHPGGPIHAGDILVYTVTVSNPATSLDNANDVVLTVPIPADTSYVPGSLQIVSGANAGAKTDAARDDQAEFDRAHNQVVYRLGSGAGAAGGGILDIGERTSVSFAIQVAPDTPVDTTLTLQPAIAATSEEITAVTVSTVSTTTASVLAPATSVTQTSPGQATGSTATTQGLHADAASSAAIALSSVVALVADAPLARTAADLPPGPGGQLPASSLALALAPDELSALAGIAAGGLGPTFAAATAESEGANSGSSSAANAGLSLDQTQAQTEGRSATDAARDAASQSESVAQKTLADASVYSGGDDSEEEELAERVPLFRALWALDLFQEKDFFGELFIERSQAEESFYRLAEATEETDAAPINATWFVLATVACEAGALVLERR
jgi:uncharacterized repeat protein (TIGR01451 family)